MEGDDDRQSAEARESHSDAVSSERQGEGEQTSKVILLVDGI